MNTFSNSKRNPTSLRSIWNYIDVLKPRETVLLTFLGLCAAIVAAKGDPAGWTFLGVFVAVLLGSGGCNGLTNYLDRNIDELMGRTCKRALPSQRIFPPQKMLPLAIGLVIVALVLAWILHPLCFAFGLAGSVASVVYRKRAMCVFQGMVAGCAPVLIGYLALSPHLNLIILFMCLLIIIWIPLHVWSVMIARRDEYEIANIAYFPLTMKPDNAIRLLFSLSILLYSSSLLLWHVADFGWFFFTIANITGIIMVIASIRLLRKKASKDSWKLYKISSFPYLGLIFLAMCFNFWL
ncbi:MAG: protoheme IX farnesyltransferase [Chloroflexi bacterium]|nr:protoheme IX farnesyltransferase [Chloroflexota bacterium]